MTMKIKKILSLEQATAGMTLAQDVLDANGNCLMAAGVALTTSHMNSLRRRSINSIAIEFEQELSAEEITAQREACITHLEHRFRQQQHDADMQCLKNVLLAYRLDSME